MEEDKWYEHIHAMNSSRFHLQLLSMRNNIHIEEMFPINPKIVVLLLRHWMTSFLFTFMVFFINLEAIMCMSQRQRDWPEIPSQNFA